MILFHHESCLVLHTFKFLNHFPSDLSVLSPGLDSIALAEKPTEKNLQNDRYEGISMGILSKISSALIDDMQDSSPSLKDSDHVFHMSNNSTSVEQTIGKNLDLGTRNYIYITCPS